MKLQIKTVEAPGIPAGRGLALCDEQGNMLPGQVACSVHFEMGEVPTAVVSFRLDCGAVEFNP